MTDIFGQYSSQETRALRSIDSSKYPDTNTDLEENLRRLNSFVDYISQYLQVMQKGVDQATQGPIERIREVLSNAGILLAGGSITDIDFGDLQYFLPALGALFGFDENVPFPINLFNAAEHFFLGYVVPLDAFVFAVEDQILAWSVRLGLNEEFILALHEFLDAFGGLTMSIGDFIDVLLGLLDIFGITDTSALGPFADLWHAISVLLGSLSLDAIGTITDPVFSTLAPWISDLARAVDQLNQIIKAFSGGVTDLKGVLNFAEMFTPFTDLMAGNFDPIVSLGEWIINGLFTNPDFLPGIMSLTGLSTIIANINSWATIDFTSPNFDLDVARQQFFASVVEPLLSAVESTVQGIITAIKPEWLGQVPLSSIADVSPNMLWNGGFKDRISISEDSDFKFDDTVGRTTLGCAKITFNGTNRKPLWANEIPAQPGDRMTFTGYARGSAVTLSGGNALEIYAVAFRADDTMIQEQLVGGYNVPGTASNWTKITAIYTAPGETSYVTMELKARSFASAGTGWVDDCEVTKASSFQIGWIDQLAEKIQNLDLSGLFDAGKLTNIIEIPLIDGTRVWSTENNVNGMFTTHFANMIAKFLGGDEGDVDEPTKANAAYSMQSIYDKLLNHENAIRDLSTPVVGSNITVDFKNYPNGPLPSNEFDISYVGAGSSTVGVSGGAVSFTSLSNDGDRMARGRYLLNRPSGDNVTLRATLKDLPQAANGGGGTPKIWGVARLSADWLNFVYIRGYCTGFLTYKCDIGCFVNGVETVFQSGVGLDWNTSITLNYGVGGNPRRYQGFSGNNKIIDYTELGNVSALPSSQPTPANYRNIGMIIEMKRGSSARSPGSLAGFSSVNI